MSGLIGLNKKQQEAVRHTEGPLLIIAGAGSGKTKALTHRIAYLINEKKVPASAILAVTFTNKAAGEMRERIKTLLTGTVLEGRTMANGDHPGTSASGRADIPYVGTFHSLGVRILRREIEQLGYQSRFAIYDGQDQIDVVKSVLEELHLDPKQFNPRMLLGMIGSAKNELQTPQQITERASEFIEEIFAKVYTGYQKKLHEANALDFDDLLMLTVTVFQKFPEVLARYQNKFRYIHIDEYQDTNHAQYILIQLLAGEHRNLAVVGDDWQAIYGWRGANMRNLLEFERDYPDAKVVLLEQNYRSTQTVLDAAGAVIAKNEGQKKKKLWTENDAGENVGIHEARDERDEAQYVVERVRKAQRSDTPLNHIVVLYRTNAQSRAVEEACLFANLPYRIIGGIKFYDRKEVKDVLAYLKFLANPKDGIAFERLLNTPARGLGPKTRERVYMEAREKHSGDLLAAMLDATNNKELDAVKATAVRELGLSLYKLREQLPDAAKSDAKKIRRISKLIDQVVRQFGFEKYLRDGSDEGEARFENVKELLTVAGERESLEDFLEEVALVSDIDTLDDRADALTLMTAHAAKGLEFKHVYMIGMEEGIFPHSRALLEPKELAEERRLCYVGMTRAKERLTLIYAEQRQLYGETQFNSRSRFMDDIPQDLVQHTSSSGVGSFEIGRGQGTAGSNNLDEPFSDEILENPFKSGDRVRHPSFGEGKITSVDDDLVDVTFDKGGSKTLSVNFAPLQKVG